MPIVNITPKIREIGRVRMGQKGPKGQPQRLEKFRLTSPDRNLLIAAAHLWGGTVQPWEGQKGQWELFIEAEELPCMVAPMEISQWYEQWSAGGCTRRCDGQTETISDQPCVCDPDNRECKITTRLSVYLPDLPGLGVWRIETHGFYAATELPQTAEMLLQLSRAGQFPDAALAIEQREVKRGGQTKKFPVPVLRIKTALRQLMTGEIIDAPALPDATPALPEGPREAPKAKMERAMQGSERGTYAQATTGRAPRPTPPQEEVYDAELVMAAVDTLRDPEPPQATPLEQMREAYKAACKTLGWTAEQQLAVVRQILNAPTLAKVSALTPAEFEQVNPALQQAAKDRAACFALWKELCGVWGADPQDNGVRSEWWCIQALQLPEAVSSNVFTPQQWADLRGVLYMAKQRAGDTPATEDPFTGE